MKENATAETTVESWVSQRDQAKAQLELAQINLGYTEVRAPFEGRLGARQVDPGNLVGSSGPTVLATIEQLHPIYVNFNLNERDALHLRQEMRRLKIELGSNIGKAPVEVGLQNEQGYPHVGVLDFADNALSTSTGTIALRGLFKNEDTTLFPGLFARVRIPLGDPRPMLVIPASAVGNDQQGDFVYVVDAKRRRRAAGDRQGAPDREGARDPQRRGGRRSRDRQRPAERARGREGRADGGSLAHALAAGSPHPDLSPGRSSRHGSTPCSPSSSSSVRFSRTSSRS